MDRRGKTMTALAWPAVLVLVVGVCAQLQSPSLSDNAFAHDNVRCHCTCPETTTPIDMNSTLMPSGCTTVDNTYVAVDTTLRGEESCTTCYNNDHDHSSSSLGCSYVVVVSDQSQCTCEYIMPGLGDENLTQHTALNCNVCMCTYEVRSQGLIQGIVILLFIVIFFLAVALLLDVLPSGWTTLQRVRTALTSPSPPDFLRRPYSRLETQTITSSKPVKALKWVVNVLLRRGKQAGDIGW
eukprot:m.14180 g.14180  ORF g.14180 m.14180 type:complete len:239 (-) comp2909_c0_seq2:270-986(-)